MGRNATDLTGRRFGRLVVLERSIERKGQSAAWRCLCDCGKETVVFAACLKAGHTNSCGCLRSESTRQRATKHGRSKCRLHNIWMDMRSRCKYNYENTKNWHGRGIKVCEEWEQSFDAFYEWAISHGYSDELSIDRIDVNGDYTPDNCRWASAKEQTDNRRTKAKLIEIDGESHTIKEWAAISGVKEATIITRLHRGKNGKDLIESPF